KFPTVPFGTDILIADAKNKDFVIAAEICEDLWVPSPPSSRHALAGATVVVNLSASNEIIGKADYRRTLAASQSGRLACAYLYADAGQGESTTDMVFAGHNLIAENGAILAESELFAGGLIFADIDLERLTQERRRMTTFALCAERTTCAERAVPAYRHIGVDLNPKAPALRRYVDPHPFVPADKTARSRRCREVIELQAQGLAKRLAHTQAKTAVIGLSGGLDSTLALLVACRAFRIRGRAHSDIHAVTMPCFGTTRRTRDNAAALARALGVTFREINIEQAVRGHFADIGQDEAVHDTAYENSQARERTQVLMDLANKTGGLVIGTGDLSELALGWATYNGDHMSMYGVNSSIPKTLVRYLVEWFADNTDVSPVLRDILDTPVSPELLPPEEGRISQKTEELVGPYELHDFFLYYVLRWGFSPAKIFFLAQNAFGAAYPAETILQWLKVFYRRFFSQQFKRSCMPDGAKVGTVNLSPRGDWRMPSDASAAAWERELEQLSPLVSEPEAHARRAFKPEGHKADGGHKLRAYSGDKLGVQLDPPVQEKRI
ncbi:MAG: NAD(+) synthase, partial [Treponema sp.]|nr:NAD(+) synthase [Treponema sp.]